MKKIIAVILGITMLMCSVAMAESAGKVTIGTIDINGAFTLQCGVPEGYQIKPVTVNRDRVLTMFQSEDKTAPIMMLTVAFDEAYSEVDRLNDMTDEELALLEASYSDPDPTVEISYGETGYGTRLLIARQSNEEYNYIDFLTIYKGYFVEFLLVASDEAEDRTLTDEQMRICIDFLTDLDFVPAGELPRTPDIAGKSFNARIGAYDPDQNTLEITLREPLVIPEDQAAGLKTGDSIEINGETFVVDKIDTGDDYLIINAELELDKNQDGDYSARLYEADVLVDAGSITVTVPEDLVFLDQIDPESLETLDEPAQHTAAEFIAQLAAESETGPGFAEDNVIVSFGEDGGLAQIERVYVPWQ